MSPEDRDAIRRERWQREDSKADERDRRRVWERLRELDELEVEGGGGGLWSHAEISDMGRRLAEDRVELLERLGKCTMLENRADYVQRVESIRVTARDAAPRLKAIRNLILAEKGPKPHEVKMALWALDGLISDCGTYQKALGG